MENVISLPIPTNATKKGPSIYADNTTLRLKYDYEKIDGTIEWIEIEFSEVLVHCFYQSICAKIGSNIHGNKMVEYDTSAWRSEVISRWNQAVGWQQYQINKGGDARFRHYVISFDDVGVFEVICGGYQVNRA